MRKWRNFLLSRPFAFAVQWLFFLTKALFLTYIFPQKKFRQNSWMIVWKYHTRKERMNLSNKKFALSLKLIGRKSVVHIFLNFLENNMIKTTFLLLLVNKLSLRRSVFQLPWEWPLPSVLGERNVVFGFSTSGKTRNLSVKSVEAFSR